LRGFDILLTSYVVYIRTSAAEWTAKLEAQRGEALQRIQHLERQVETVSAVRKELPAAAAALTKPQWQGHLKDYDIPVFTPKLELTCSFKEWAQEIRVLRSQCVVADLLLNPESPPNVIR